MAWKYNLLSPQSGTSATHYVPSAYLSQYQALAGLSGAVAKAGHATTLLIARDGSQLIVTYLAHSGYSHQPEVSTDVESWSHYGAAVSGNDATNSFTINPADADRRYFPCAKHATAVGEPRSPRPAYAGRFFISAFSAKRVEPLRWLFHTLGIEQLSLLLVCSKKEMHLMFMYFDPLYLLFMLPALILAGIASAKTKGTFKKYSRVAASSRLTGAQAARRMLDRNGLQHVQIHRARGFLSDHYNPANRSLNLSPDVHDSQSLSSIGVACHEAGHALQHAEGYAPLQWRSAMVPASRSLPRTGPISLSFWACSCRAWRCRSLA